LDSVDLRLGVAHLVEGLHQAGDARADARELPAGMGESRGAPCIPAG
jgi:hypothetical protein